MEILWCMEIIALSFFKMVYTLRCLLIVKTLTNVLLLVTFLS